MAVGSSRLPTAIAMILGLKHRAVSVEISLYFRANQQTAERQTNINRKLRKCSKYTDRCFKGIHKNAT